MPNSDFDLCWFYLAPRASLSAYLAHTNTKASTAIVIVESQICGWSINPLVKIIESAMVPILAQKLIAASMRDFETPKFLTKARIMMQTAPIVTQTVVITMSDMLIPTVSS